MASEEVASVRVNKTMHSEPDTRGRERKKGKEATLDQLLMINSSV